MCESKASPDFLEDSFSFLSDYQWLHDFQVTHILKENVLRQINEEWKPHLKAMTLEDLNQLPFLGDSSLNKYPEWPESLHTFLSRAHKLRQERKYKLQDHSQVMIDVNMAKGMNPKKKHEVTCMAAYVAEVMIETDCNMVVDIGSGLGYLDHVLHQVYGYPVIGLEVSEAHKNAAEARAVKQGLQCGSVESTTFLVTNTEEGHREFDSVVTEAAARFSNQCCHGLLEEAPECDEVRVCLVGLHSCGDLTVSLMSLFHSSTTVKAMVGVGCCYHKMEYIDGQFSKFPLSNSAKEALARVQSENPKFELSPFTFRLGAQETRCRWGTHSKEEHTAHTHQVFYRGLLELTDLPLDTIHASVRKCDFSSFDSFLETFIANAQLSEDESETIQSTMRDLYERHVEDLNLIEPFTGLQVVVQPVIENLIYRDRQCWLRDQGYDTVQVVPIFDDAISPRNLALVATKYD